MKQNRGITLIALIVTIVVLLILAGVTISIVFGENGVINKAQEAALQTKIGAVKEKVAMEMIDLETDSTLTGNPLTVENIIGRFENLDWVGSATEESDDTVRIISTDGVIIDIKVTSNGGYELINQGVDDGEPYPTMTIEQLPTEGIAGEKIKIKVTANVEQTKETTRITTIENVTTGETKDYTEGGLIFEVLTNGEYTFRATTNKGKTKTSKINVNIAEGGIIGITIEPSTPRNTKKTGTQNGIETGTIKVSISYGEIELTNADKYQYRIGTEGEWQTSSSNQITVDATENTIIVARYYDGKNSIGVQNYSIQNVDNVAPNAFTPTVTETTTDSITVSASTTDTASEGAGESIPGILRYEYSIDGSSWKTTNTLQNLSDGTSYTVYVKAIDKAGNETIGQVSAQTEVANQAPTDLSVSYNTKSTNSITINAKANDADGNQLTYTLYTAISENGNYTEKANQTAASNMQVSLQATGLSQYTTYYYYVTTSDGKETVKSSTSSVRTYCPGTGLTCPDGNTSRSTCSNCNGVNSNRAISNQQCKYYRYTHAGEGIGKNCELCGNLIERASGDRYPCKLLFQCPFGYEWVKIPEYDNVIQIYFCSKDCMDTFYSSVTPPIMPTHECECGSCDGKGYVEKVTKCRHGLGYTHQYCSHNGTEYTTQHD